MVPRLYFYSIVCPEHQQLHAEGVIKIKSFFPDPWKAIIHAKKQVAAEMQVNWSDLHIKTFNRV